MIPYEYFRSLARMEGRARILGPNKGPNWINYDSKPDQTRVMQEWVFVADFTFLAQFNIWFKCKGAPMARGPHLSSRSPDSGSVIALLVLVIILFAIVVGYGWMRLLAQELTPVFAGALAALITMIAILLAQQIARAMVARQEGGGQLGQILFLYPILFIISALGTINAAFYNFEGSSVLQQVIDDAERKLAALAGASTTGLRDADREARTAEVERLLIQLDGEIRNPTGNCGVGPEARAIIGRITAILPEFREFSRRGSQPNCEDEALTRLSETYRNNALQMLNINPDERRRAELRTEIAGQTAEARRQLVGAETNLARGGGFGAGYQDAQLALENAATAYSESRERLASAAPDAAGRLAPAIEISRARYLGSITAMPGTLAARLNYWTTWVYFVIAVLLDFFLVYLFVEGHRTAGPPVPRRDRARSRDPQYLWVNEGA